MLDAAEGQAMAAALLNARIYDPDQKIPDVRRWLNAEAFLAREAHASMPTTMRTAVEGKAKCSTSPGTMPAFGRSASARSRAWPRAALALFTELLRSAHGPNLLRVNGIVALADDPARPVIIQSVQHVFHPPLLLPAWPDGDHTTRIVFILRDVEQAFVDALWGAVTGVPSPNNPELAALTINPLVPRKGDCSRKLCCAYSQGEAAPDSTS